jgi:hypothetical protein
VARNKAKIQNLGTVFQDSPEQEKEKEEEQRPVKSMPKYEYDNTHPETEESPYYCTWYVI